MSVKIKKGTFDSKPPAPFCRGCGCPLDDSNIDCPHEGKYGYCKGCCERCKALILVCVACGKLAQNYYRERDGGNEFINRINPSLVIICNNCAKTSPHLYITDSKGRIISKCKKCSAMKPLGVFVPADHDELDCDEFWDSRIENICRECANGMRELIKHEDIGDYTMSEIIDIDKERSA